MSSIELDVRNMSCGACVNHVTQALNQVTGVAGVQVDLRSGRVRVQVADTVASALAANPSLTTALVAALDAAGYPAAPATSRAAAAPVSRRRRAPPRPGAAVRRRKVTAM